MKLKVFFNGLLTGLFLQLAVGPVFFFITNLALQRSFLDGIAGVLAVTTVDYFYITLAILGIGKLLEKKKVKKVFGIVSSLVLILFGGIIINDVIGADAASAITASGSTSLIGSYTSVFLLTISSPMTIVFFTSLFSAKAIEYKYTKRDLWIFGLSVGLATFLFMGSSVVIFSLIKRAIPLVVIQTLNIIVGALLILYGLIRLKPLLKGKM